MKFILGKKIAMTQVWQGEDVVAATKIQAGPCRVIQVKNSKQDGYSAVQLGFGKRHEKNIKFKSASYSYFLRKRQYGSRGPKMYKRK